MATRAGKDAPVGITAHVTSLPQRLVGIVQSLRYALVDGLIVEHGFLWLIGPCGIDIHPVVLLGVVGYGVVLVTHPLSVTPMTALEGVEVYPRCLAPPMGRRITAPWMIGHQVVLVYLLDGGGKRLPNLGTDVALDVAAHDPDDVRTVFVTVSKETAIALGLLHAELATLDETAPYTHHTDEDIVLRRHINDIVHVIPVGIRGFSQQHSLLVVRRDAIGVPRRHAVQHLYLYHVIFRLVAGA